MFEIGDIVRLKSGGPEMTVCEIADAGFRCYWFDGGELYHRYFVAGTLEFADDGFYEVEFEEPYVNFDAMDAYFVAPDPELTDEELEEIDQLLENEKLLKDALGR